MNKYQKQLHKEIRNIRRIQCDINDRLNVVCRNGKKYYNLDHLWNELNYITSNRTYRRIKQAIKKNRDNLTVESFYYCPICFSYASYLKFTGGDYDEVECNCGFKGSFNKDIIVI